MTRERGGFRVAIPTIRDLQDKPLITERNIKTSVSAYKRKRKFKIKNKLVKYKIQSFPMQIN